MAVFMSILCLLLALYCSVTLCVSTLYWYERLNTPEPALSPPPPGPAAVFFGSINTFGGLLLSAFTFIISPLSGQAIRKGDTSGLPPLILVHGLYNTAGIWIYLGRRLRKAGFATSTFAYRSFRTSPQAILHKLEEHIRDLEAAFPGRKPLLICHSLGGILLRHWLLLPGNQERLSGLICLGTPHGGSKTAALGPGPLAKAITPGGRLITALRDAPPPAASLPCLSLASSSDELVLPASALVPPKGWRLRVVHRVGHVTMLFCPRTAAVLMEELEAMVRP